MRKILVVDDDQDIREIITVILEMEGYQVTGLDNGRQVMDSLRRDAPDAILLDVMLGDSDGLEICEEIKLDPQTRAIPVMIVSASHGYRNPGQPGCEADDYLAKPFDVKDLLSKVKRLAA